MFASIFITVKSIQAQLRSDDGLTIKDVFTDKTFFTLIVSMLSTYVLYFAVSIIFLDPWHMFTSVSGALSKHAFSIVIASPFGYPKAHNRRSSSNISS
jgi:chitin synthase